MSEREGRTAIVTGGAQGIGRAVVEHLLADGWRVMVADIDDEAGRQVVKSVKTLGHVAFQHSDVADEASVERLVAHTIEHFGRITALVNNAGIMRRRPLAELDLADWQAVIATNLTGAMLCAKHAAAQLAEHGGAIANIASTRALMSESDTEAYAASKGGLVALTHALAISLGPAVRVNCVSPGWIDTSGWSKAGAGAAESLSEADHAQHPAGRVGRPEDVAAAVGYLLNDETGFMTGANLVLDGGMTRKMIYAE